jgi:hypothetical protein
MNDDIRSTLATAVGSPPPLGFTSATVVQSARRHRTRRRFAGAGAAVVGVVAVTGGVFATVPAGHHPGPGGSPAISSAAHPPGQTKRELATQLDNAVHAAAPANLNLIRREVTWLERTVAPDVPGPALWRAQYWIDQVDGSRFNVATNERPPANQRTSCATEGDGALDCHETTAADGTKLVIITIRAGNVFLHGVQNIRRDGTEAAAYVLYPHTRRAPVTDAQLTRVATDHAIHYTRPSDVRPPPAAR